MGELTAVVARATIAIGTSCNDFPPVLLWVGNWPLKRYARQEVPPVKNMSWMTEMTQALR